jgi:hypothetical protein
MPATERCGRRADQRVPAPGGVRPPEESQTLLTAKPLELDYQHEIIRWINQERDQAPAVRAEMQSAQRHRDVITFIAAALVLHRIHDHDRVHECR